MTKPKSGASYDVYRTVFATQEANVTPNADLETTYLRAAGAAHTHCRYCGRELIEITEPGLWDEKTGERIIEVWKQCPRFAASWRNLWMGGCHDSFLRDNPVHGREWR